MITKNPGDHSELGMSQADRWCNCPGSVALLRTIPKRPAGPAAREGTDSHSLGEWCLKEGKNPGDYPDASIGSSCIDHDMQLAVGTYVDYIRGRQAELTDLFGACTLIVEGLADNSHLHKDLWGRYDCILLVPFLYAEVIDYKNGGGKVYEADCLQGAGYALHPWHHMDVPNVRFTIVQPNAPHVEGPIRSHDYSSQDLESLAAYFRAHAKATENPKAELVPGAWCRGSFCDAQPTCPALKGRVSAVAMADFAMPVAEMAPPRPETLTPAQLKLVVEQAGLIKGWINSVLSYAMGCAMRGSAPEGLKVVQGKQGNRRWAAAPQVVIERLVMAIPGTTRAQLVVEELKSPTQVEKELGKKAFAEHADLVNRAPGGPNLVPLSDPRPEMALGAAVDFADPAEEADF